VQQLSVTIVTSEDIHHTVTITDAVSIHVQVSKGSKSLLLGAEYSKVQFLVYMASSYCSFLFHGW
jgi:hypothetical protein